MVLPELPSTIYSKSALNLHKKENPRHKDGYVRYDLKIITKIYYSESGGEVRHKGKKVREGTLSNPPGGQATVTDEPHVLRVSGGSGQVAKPLGLGTPKPDSLSYMKPNSKKQEAGA